MSHKLKVSADLQVSLISKYTKVTEALEALVSTMAYHVMHKQYDQDTDLSLVLDSVLDQKFPKSKIFLKGKFFFHNFYIKHDILRLFAKKKNLVKIF